MKIVVLSPARLDPYYRRVLAPFFASATTEVVGAVIDGQVPPPMTAKLRRELKRGRGAYVVVMAARAIWRRAADGDEVDAADHFAHHGVETRTVGDLYAESTLDWVRDRSPDCVVRLGFGIIRDPVLSLAPHGVLSYHHGDMRRYRGQPPAFWELYEGADRMGVTVQRLTAELDAGALICERWFPVERGDSWMSLRRRAYGDSAGMMYDACTRLADRGFEPVMLADGELGPLYTTPNGRQWLSLQLKVAGRRLARWTR